MMKDPATTIGVIHACFEGVTQVAFVILGAYTVRSLFHYLEARLTAFGPEPFLQRRELPDMEASNVLHVRPE